MVVYISRPLSLLFLSLFSSQFTLSPYPLPATEPRRHNAITVARARRGIALGHPPSEEDAFVDPVYNRSELCRSTIGVKTSRSGAKGRIICPCQEVQAALAQLTSLVLKVPRESEARALRTVLDCRFLDLALYTTLRISALVNRLATSSPHFSNPPRPSPVHNMKVSTLLLFATLAIATSASPTLELRGSRPNGLSCRHDDTCASQYCQRGTCAAKKAEGHVCSKPSGCWSGYCGESSMSTCREGHSPDAIALYRQWQVH